MTKLFLRIIVECLHEVLYNIKYIHDRTRRTLPALRQETLDPSGNEHRSTSRSQGTRKRNRAALRAADQSVLRQRCERQLWKARAYADAGADQLRRHHAPALARGLL